MKEVAGHAVRTLQFNCGMIDYYLESGETPYLEASKRLWTDMTNKKMYITGAVGGRFVYESFGRDYELPHENSYTETCANIANFMWNWRLLSVNGEAQYADLMELVMYNSVISGVSLEGTKYFYVNPHANGAKTVVHPWHAPGMETITRKPWFPCSCCPSNLARTLASIPSYFYSTSKEGLWVHLFDNNTLEWKLEDGTGIKLIQKTKYPWNGRIDIDLSCSKESEFSLYLRIPGWAKKAALTVENKST